MAETNIRVISYRAFLTHEVMKTTFDDMFAGVKFLGIKAREPDYPIDWKAGEPQQVDIDFRYETMIFKGTVLLADLNQFTKNETTKHSVLGPFSIYVDNASKPKPGPTQQGVEEEGVAATAGLAAAGVAAAVGVAAAASPDAAPSPDTAAASPDTAAASPDTAAASPYTAAPSPDTAAPSSDTAAPRCPPSRVATPNPKEIQAFQYNGINTPREYIYDRASPSASFMTNDNGVNRYWIATGNEKELQNLIKTFKPA
jgi:hypothetical protein